MLAGGARPRPHRAHPPVGEPVRAEAGHALPVAADGGPEGDRPQAPVPAQGLRPDARTSTRSARARAPAPCSPILALGGPPRGRRARARGHAGARPEAGAARGAASTRRSTCSAGAAEGRDPALGHRSTTASARTTSGASWTKSEQEQLSPHCPELQGCIRCGVCIETPNPSYALPEKWKGLRDAAALREAGARAGRREPDAATPAGCASSRS